MLTGLLLWGGVYLSTVVVISVFSTPAHQLPAYLIFELVCLAPWTVWLFVVAARKGQAVILAVLVQACVVAVLTYIVEVRSTYAKYWDFFQEKDVLCGVMISGVPLEEFLFFPFAINFSILLYLYICDYLKDHKISDISIHPRKLFLVLGGFAIVFAGLGFYVATLRDLTMVVPAMRTWEHFGIPRYTEGPRGYGWTLIILFSVSFNFLLFYIAERNTLLILRAAILIVGIFFLINFLVELFGTGRGWWVYNGQQVSGIWVVAIPLENLAAYLTGVTLPLALFEGTRTLLGERGYP